MIFYVVLQLSSVEIHNRKIRRNKKKKHENKKFSNLLFIHNENISLFQWTF